jgi:integrase/recombinase XerD
MKLRKIVEHYVTYRKTLGELFLTNERILLSFVRAIGRQANLHDIKPKQIDKFLAGTGPLTATWHIKHQALRGFYGYVIGRGYIKKSPLPMAIPKRPPPFVPYIYTRQNLRMLLDASFTYQKNRGRLEPYMVHTILSLLYGAGLRIKEALMLTLSDVDLTRKLLIIRETKFRKTRLVPLGKHLIHELSQYAARREKEGYAQDSDAPFFIGRNGKSVNQYTIEDAFRRICEHGGIRRTDGATYQPRLHDLRHTFAVHCLIAWYEKGADVQNLLPILSVYLGHHHLAATSVYLTMTPTLLNQANNRFQKYASLEAPHEE